MFIGDAKDALAAKTGQGIVDWRRDKCLGQLRLPGCRADLGIPEMTIACVLPTAMISVLFYLNWELALVALLPLPFASWLVYRAVSKVRKEWRPVRERLEELTAQVQDNLSGVSVIKSFVQERKQASEIETRSRRLHDDMLRASTLSFVPVGVIERLKERRKHLGLSTNRQSLLTG